MQNVIFQIMWAAIITGLLRGVAWVFGIWIVHPIEFWIITALLVVAVMQVLNVSGRGNAPKLVVNIDRISIAAAKEAPGTTIVIVFAGITNWGQPSVVENFALKIKLISKQTVDTKATYVKDLTVEKLVYHEADALFVKTSPTPIATGTTVRGFLVFRIEGGNITQQDITRAGTVFRFAVHDFRKHEWKTEYTWPVNPIAEVGYLPGMLPLEAAPEAMEIVTAELPKAKEPGP